MGNNEKAVVYGTSQQPAKQDATAVKVDPAKITPSKTGPKPVIETISVLTFTPSWPRTLDALFTVV